MASALVTCPINETLLVLSEKSRLERDREGLVATKPGDDATGGRLGEYLKRVCFRSLAAITAVPTAGGSMWAVEQVVMGLQVRGAGVMTRWRLFWQLVLKH